MPDLPTAIFSCNNKMTLGLVQAISELKVSCPEQVSVLSFDDFPWTSYFQPRLTAIAQPSHEMGRRAMEMLLSAIDPESAEGSAPSESGGGLKRGPRGGGGTAPPQPGAASPSFSE